MIRILYLHSLSHMGGGETTLYTLLTHLDRSRFEPTLLLPQDGPLAEELAKKNVAVRHFPFPRGLFNRYPPGFSMGAFMKMRALAQELKIDCIHVNDSYLMLYAGLLSKSLGIPVILTAHGWWDAHFLHQDLLNKLFADRVLCVSEVVRKSICRRGFVKPEKTATTYLGVDTGRFKPPDPAKREATRKELGIAEDEVVLTIVGRFILRKGFEEYFQAGSILLKSFPKARFLVVGEKIFSIWEETDEVRQQILNFVKSDEKLQERVIFTGFRKDTEALLGASDILISSAWWESLGMAILEAMSCGVPVISTNVGGPAETVLDGATGFLVTPKDPQAIADKALELARSPGLRARMGAQARERVVQNYSIDRYAERLQRVYEEAVEARGNNKVNE